MSCDPILDMRVSQADLKVIFERNKQLAQRNSHLANPKPPLVDMHKIYPPYERAEITAAKNVVYPVYGKAEVAAKRPVRNKFRNVKVEYEGMRFDSKHELKCWKNLVLLEKAGEIKDLKRQVKFEFEIEGTHCGKFTADFVWLENGKKIVADAKSEITCKETAYRLRKRIFEALYAPLVIREL